MIESIPSLHRISLSSSWTQRKLAITQLGALITAESHALVASGKLNQVLDIITDRLSDGNYKVVVHALQLEEAVCPLLARDGGLMIDAGTLTSMVQGIAGNLSSANKQVCGNFAANSG